MTSDDMLFAITAKLHDTMKKARYDLEIDDQGYGESQFLRGKIQACKDVLELVKPKVAATNIQPMSQVIGKGRATT